MRSEGKFDPTLSCPGKIAWLISCRNPTRFCHLFTIRAIAQTRERVKGCDHTRSFQTTRPSPRHNSFHLNGSDIATCHSTLRKYLNKYEQSDTQLPSLQQCSEKKSKNRNEKKAKIIIIFFFIFLREKKVSLDRNQLSFNALTMDSLFLDVG